LGKERPVWLKGKCFFDADLEALGVVREQG
jgi:hypothetical protein